MWIGLRSLVFFYRLSVFFFFSLFCNRKRFGFIWSAFCHLKQNARHLPKSGGSQTRGVQELHKPPPVTTSPTSPTTVPLPYFAWTLSFNAFYLLDLLVSRSCSSLFHSCFVLPCTELSMHCFPFDCYADSTEKSSVDAHCFDLARRASDPNTVKRTACVAGQRWLIVQPHRVCVAASVSSFRPQQVLFFTWVRSGLTLFRPFSNPKRPSYG